MMQKGHNHDVATCTAVNAGRANVTRVAPGPRGVDFAVRSRVLVNVHFMKVVVAIEQSDIQVLPFASARPVKQCSGNTKRRGHTGTNVSQTDNRNIRRLIRFPDHRSHARIRLGNVVVSRFIGERTGLAQGRYGTQNNIFL